MCSLNCDCDGISISDTVFTKQQKTCRSCQKTGVVVLRKKDVYCRDCFLASATHKFRATLGKTKVMKPSDNVLVTLTGNQSSFALLHMLRSGFNEEQKKKFMFNVFVVFIEDGCIHKLSVNERMGLVKNFKEKMLKYEFPCYIATLSDSLCDTLELQNSFKINENNDRQLIEFFENVNTMSSTEDLLNLCKLKLAHKIARQKQCNKIFTDDVGTDLAIKLLSCFSLGRGNQASIETGFCDSRFPHCKILRPLREFTRKEIFFYSHFHNIDYVIAPSLTTKMQTNCSIQKLTEKFVTDLQETFPSTVYTIFRTGEKISDDTDNCESVMQFKCLLCYNKIKDRTAKDYSVMNNIVDFSKILPENKLKSCSKNDLKQCCKFDLSQKLGHADLEKSFCYGCLLILKDMKNINLLPNHILDAAFERKNLEKMKEEISEFLIVDD